MEFSVAGSDIAPSFGASRPQTSDEGLPGRCVRFEGVSNRLHLESAAWLVVPWALVFAGVIALALTQRRMWRRIAVSVAVSCSAIAVGAGYSGRVESECRLWREKKFAESSQAEREYAVAEEASAVRECAFGDGAKHRLACVQWLRRQADDADADTREVIWKKLDSLCAGLPRDAFQRKSRALDPCARP